LRKYRFWNGLDVLWGEPVGGNKVLLTMFARQLFPTWRAKERNR
jgi:hypothetical protein